MTTHSVALSATLDRPVPQHEAMPIGRRIAGEHLITVAIHDNRFSIVTDSAATDPIDGLTSARDAFVEVLAAAGFTVVAWDAIEALSDAEVDRRIEAASIPPMVNVKEFAALCGFTSHQRIYELDTERRKAAEAGQTHPFPTPVVPGWWIKAAAERYAATRKTKPGPAPRRANPLTAPRDYPKPIEPEN